MTSTSSPRRPAPRSTTLAGARRAAPVATLAVGALLLAGCGSDSAPATKAAAATVPATATVALADDVPARAAGFAEADLRPSGDTKAGLSQLLGLLRTSGGGSLAKRLDLDDHLPAGKRFAQDVLPHLGDHAAAFLLGGDPATAGTTSTAKTLDGAIVAEVADADGLRKALGTGGRTVTVGGQQVRIEGERATWIGDHVAAFGTEAAVRATIAAAGGDDLAGNPRFTDALEQVRSTDPLGVAWVDLQQAPVLNAVIAHAAKDGEARLSKDGKGHAASSSGADAALDAVPKGLRKDLEGKLGSFGSSSGLHGGIGFGSTPTIPTIDATYAAALEVRSGRVTVLSGGTVPKGSTSAADADAAAQAVAALPAGSWVAFGGALSPSAAAATKGKADKDVGELAKELGIDVPAKLQAALQGVTAVSAGAQGTDLLAAGGAVVLKAADAAGAQTLQRELGALLQKETSLKPRSQAIPGTTSGLVAGLPGLPLQLASGVQGDRLAIGLGASSVTKALATSGRLSADPVYARVKAALGGEAPTLLLQPKPLIDLAGTFASGQAAQLLKAASAIDFVAASRQSTGATTWHGTFVVSYQGAATP